MWTFIFWNLVIMAAAWGVSYALAKNKSPGDDIRTEPGKFDFPTVTEGTKYPIIGGLGWIDAPIIGVFGDIKDEEVGVRLTGTGGQYYYVHKYYYGALLKLAQGSYDVVQIKCGDDLVWPDPDNKYTLDDTSATSVDINLPELYGGLHEHDANVTGSGGVVGTIDICDGNAAQTLNSYLESRWGSKQSANRGVTSAVLRQVYIGLSPQIQPWKFLLKQKTGKKTDGSDQWYPSKAIIRDYELNPVHWLRELYTHKKGLNQPDAMFDDAIWQAAADTLYTEGFGILPRWEGNQTLDDQIKETLTCINATIYEDYENHQFVIKLIRDDYVLAELEEFDENDIESIDGFAVDVMHTVADVTYLEYWNVIDNCTKSVPSHDAALASCQSAQFIPNEVSYKQIADDTLAGQVAAREQQQVSAFASAMKLYCKRTMSHLLPGDVVKISFAPEGIVSMIVRIGTIDYGTFTDGKITIECCRDIFGSKTALYSAPPATGGGDINETDEYLGFIISDEISVTDAAAASLTLYEVSVYDSISVTDSVLASIPVLEIVVYDDISITESVSVA